MKTKHILVFSDISVLVNRLQNLLKEANIDSIVKDNVESARLGGFGSLSNNIELFVLENDLEKALPIINTFKKEIAK